MKSIDGKSQRRAETKKEDQPGESLRRKKMQLRKQVGQSRNVVFPVISGFGGSKSRKVGSLKWWVQSGAKCICKSKHGRSGAFLEVEMSKKCMSVA